jgi:hypothetical protein
MVPLPNFVITLLFSKMRLKRKDFQEIVRLTWAQEVPSSNLGAPTKTSRVLSVVYRKLTSPKTDLWNSRRQEVSIHKSFIPKSSSHDKFSEARGARSAIQKPLNGGQLSARHLASMGKIRGTLCISRLLNLRICKLVVTHSGRPELCNVSQFVVLIVPLNRSDVFIGERQRRLLRHGFG